MVMKFTSKGKNKGNSEGWGMGFLLVFFPEEEQPPPNPKKPPNFNLFSITRSNSSNLLLHKAQSTISICLLLLFLTALLFTLSTLPSSSSPSARRRLLHHFSPPVSNLSHALQKMGKLYRRGTRPMNDLVVAHAPPSLSPHQFRLFLRFFYRSTLAARSDLVFILPAKFSHFDVVILQENDFFFRLLDRYADNNLGNDSVPNPVAHFLKLSRKEKENEKESGEPIWGKRSNKANFTQEAGIESNRPSYGSVVAFDVDELDPENSLSGFFDHVPMSLRRWACYPMLLGRVRRNFKHVTLIDVKEMLLLGDPLGRFRSQSPESVHLKLTSSVHSTSGKHGRRSPIQTRPKPVHPGIIMGGSKGIRRLSNEMLTVIVRASMQQQRKRKNPITESGLLSELAGNEFVLKNVVVNLEAGGESVPELSSLSGTSLKSGMKNYSVVRRGNSNNLDYNYLMKYLCSFPIDSTVYSDC